MVRQHNGKIDLRSGFDSRCAGYAEVITKISGGVSTLKSYTTPRTPVPDEEGMPPSAELRVTRVVSPRLLGGVRCRAPAQQSSWVARSSSLGHKT